MTMARIPINSCGHIDFPCCGCDNVMLTGEDALEQIREEDDAEFEDDACNDDDGLSDMEADAMTLASAGFGCDEDYGRYHCFDDDLY